MKAETIIEILSENYACIRCDIRSVCKNDEQCVYIRAAELIDEKLEELEKKKK